MTSKFPYPETNPHVSDEFIFANESHIVFNQSFVGYLEHFINTTIPLLAILCASLVIYLSIFKTPDYIKPYAQVIRLTAFIDFGYGLFDFLCQVRVQTAPNIVMYSISGPAALLNFQFQCYMFCGRRFFQVVGFLTLPIGYIFKYKILKTNITPSFLYIAAYFTACFVLSGFGSWTGKIAYCDFDNPNRTDFGHYWYKETPVPTLLVTPSDYFPTVIHNHFNTVAIAGSYLLSIFFGTRTMMELRRQTALKIDQNLKLQKEVGRVLLAQSFVPLIASVLPILIPRILVALEVPLNYYYFDFNTKMTTLFPLLNSLSSLYYILPYRKFCFKVLKNVLIKGVKTSVVEMTPNNAVNQNNYVHPRNDTNLNTAQT
ncbi:hypothetical protein M3Y97_01050100 [Aphelenchoides bicaudatus]|nr:hypothetical protein M3Y97_01050100 [Aphelenchoides bicaudatus]